MVVSMTIRCAALFGAFALVVGLAPPETAGQVREPSSTISSDRPGLGDGAYVLAPGVWQAELGFGIDGGGGERVYSIGQGVLRFGLSGLEVRLYPNSYMLLRGEGSSESGFQDVGVGLKVPLSAGGGGVRTSVVAGVTLPTGSDLLTADKFTGFSTLVLEGALSDQVSLAVNAGYSFPFDDAADGAIALIVTPGFPISGVDGLSGYVGYAGFVYPEEWAADHVLEAGLSYLASADVQLDLNGGWNPDPQAWFVGVGVALRRR
jgi:hypothetical protein